MIPERAIFAPLKSRNFDSTIALHEKQISQIISFLKPMPKKYSTEQIPLLLSRMEHYRIFMRRQGMFEDNFARKPITIMDDAEHSLLLYQEFGGPKIVDSLLKDDETPTASVLCGFNVKAVESWPDDLFPDTTQPIGLHVIQVQARRFADRNITRDTFDFIDYKNLFRHFIEQLALFGHTHFHIFDYTFFPKDFPFDTRTAERYADEKMFEEDLDDKQAQDELTSRHMERIWRNREKWLVSKGYHKFRYFIPWDETFLNEGFIKPISSITPDSKLQKRLCEIYEQSS